MTKVKIVLGLSWGDEGKGITTDYLCKKHPMSIVVRFSGGQQAAHNVKIGNVSHIHSSFGSGTLRGVPSYFSEHCTMYPTRLVREYNVLLDKGVNPILYVHPLTMVTTPYDVAYNRLRTNHHGTCGIGIGTTMTRSISSNYKLFAVDLFHKEILEEKLKAIYWYYRSIISDCEIKRYNTMVEEEYQEFDEAVTNLPIQIKPYDFLRRFNTIIFEGSQGIMLDMDHGIFPNVTYANTTSKNAIEISKKLNIDNIEVFYVTRCYQTRHGDGWMSNQDPIELINNEDETNIFNQWQGSFKIGELDYTLLNQAINIDNIYSEDCIKSISITCLDQRPGFEFDYSKMNTLFNLKLNSYSPDSKFTKEKFID